MNEIDKTIKPTKLLWVDLEMTGLDPSQNVIIEVAVLITDFDFKTLAKYEAVISQPEEKIQNMNEWSAIQHAKSGLIDKIRNNGKTEKQVIIEIVKLIKNNFGEEPAILAGNSIYNDRKFIEKWWPEVASLLHYRMLDVTSFKILMENKLTDKFEKNDNHRALDDIGASIKELEFYLDNLSKISEKP
jgi:oligoribonuclease